jgi:hypothetical protein
MQTVRKKISSVGERRVQIDDSAASFRRDRPD